MSTFAMTMAGELSPTTATFDVTNPATGQPFAQAPACTREQLDVAMEAAAKAYVDWKSNVDLRRGCLRAAGEAIRKHQQELASILTSEQGKPFVWTGPPGGDATFEVAAAAMWLEYFAGLELPREVIQDDDSAFVEILRRPLGVVAAITPWNFPLMLACWKVAPALLAGNTVVLKPSPFTPLTTLRFGEILQDLLPPGVVNVVSGGDEVGSWMTSHPVPRKVSFTGSVRTGKKVAAAAAPDLKRLTLELGGNDPAIVLDDADPNAVADGLFWSAFTNCGQICAAIKRVYVPERLHDDVVGALAERARSVKVGDGTEPGTEIGPINNVRQFVRVGELVEDALAQGGRAVAGGHKIDRDGYFFEPTILTGLTDGTRIVDEEQFGPVLPVIPYRDVDDAIERANATHFGLCASVWSADPDLATEVASRLECGTSWVNVHLAITPYQPFGGAKWSGIGVENGPWGLLGFTELQVLYRAKS